MKNKKRNFIIIILIALFLIISITCLINHFNSNVPNGWGI